MLYRPSMVMFFGTFRLFRLEFSISFPPPASPIWLLFLLRFTLETTECKKRKRACEGGSPVLRSPNDHTEVDSMSACDFCVRHSLDCIYPIAGGAASIESGKKANPYEQKPVRMSGSPNRPSEPASPWAPTTANASPAPMAPPAPLAVQQPIQSFPTYQGVPNVPYPSYFQLNFIPQWGYQYPRSNGTDTDSFPANIPTLTPASCQSAIGRCCGSQSRGSRNSLMIAA